ncbi:MAG: hypothetical protein HZA60_05125 [Deltaproteobacteria bacterium]|nr:hypothetical protein [Deltaproteobacteria bacterium]
MIRAKRPFSIPAVAASLFGAGSYCFLQYGQAGLPFLAICAVLSGALVSSVAACWERTAGNGLDRGTGSLFGIHVVGGGVGAAAAGFYLLPGIGLKASGLVALSTTVLSLPLYFRAGESLRPGEEPGAIGALAVRKSKSFLPAFLAGVTGTTGLGAEILWGRWISQMAGSSIYTYFAILVISVVAFGCGCLYAGGGFPSRERGENPFGFTTYSVLSIAYPVTLLSLLVLLAGRNLSPLCLFASAGLSLPLATFLLTTVILFPVLFSSGAFFSLALRWSVPDGLPGYETVFLSNCIGAAAGGLLVPFLFVPALGVGGAVVAVVALNTVPAFFLRSGRPGNRTRAVVLAASAAALSVAAVWLRSHPLYFLLPGTVDAFSKGGGESGGMPPWKGKPSFYKEGAYSTVIVGREGGNAILIVDGKPESNSLRDLPTQKMLGDLPFLVRGEIFRDVLLIGLGSGATLETLLAHPVARVECVEISPEVVAAVEGGLEEKYVRAVRDPRVRVSVRDGRRYLRDNRSKFDLIISQPSNPWVTGASSLFTREAFLAMASSLSPSGAAVVWFQTYGTTATDFLVELETLRSVFPHILAFSFMPGDVIFLCSLMPIKVDLQTMQAAVSAGPHVLQGVSKKTGITDVYSVLGGFFGGIPPAEAGEAPRVPLNTDDKPCLEYRLASTIAEKDPYQAYSVINSPVNLKLLYLEGFSTMLHDRKGDFLVKWGEAMCRIGFARYAEGFFLEALKIQGEKARLVNDLGIVKFEQKNYDESKRLFMRALALDPGNASARENLLSLEKRGP